MTRHTPRLNWAFFWLLLGTCIWVGLIVCEPWLSSGTPFMKLWSAGITLFFSPICHQQTGRCYVLMGNSLPVCARCLGIYLGFLIGIIGARLFIQYKPIPPGRFWLLGLALPTMVEFILEKAGLIHGSLILRSAIGAATGFIVPFYVLPALTELMNRQNMRR